MKMCIQPFTETDGNVYTDTTYTAGFWISSTLTRLERISIWLWHQGSLSWFTVLLLEKPNISCTKWEKALWIQKKIPHSVSHDGDTIHKVNNIIQTGLRTGKTTDLIKFNTVNLCAITGGVTLERVGIITRDEKKLRNSEYLFNVWLIYETRKIKGFSSILCSPLHKPVLLPIQ